MKMAVRPSFYFIYTLFILYIPFIFFILFWTDVKNLIVFSCFYQKVWYTVSAHNVS